MGTAAISIQRVGHCNVNCTSLEQSVDFYCQRLGLKQQTHTNPIPQDGTAFGMPGPVQWDAWILGDHRGAFTTSTALDLLEWQQPLPTGAPYPVAHHLGFAALTLAVPADAPSGELTDPDGVLLRTVADDVAGVEMRGVTVNCSDLDESLAWYQTNLGLELVGTESTGAYDTASLVVAAAPFFTIELREWLTPRPVGRPYEAANHVGIYRMAFMVTDAQAAHEQLTANGVRSLSPPAWLDMGPEVPIDGLWALFFPDPDGTCLELIASPGA
jgi:catechol 2,3-dioxygenase-like lactoylglutathione lyase family enzyme